MLLPIHEFSISNVDATATSLLRRDIALGGEAEGVALLEGEGTMLDL